MKYVIHTRLKFTLEQDMVFCQRGEKEAPTDRGTEGRRGNKTKSSFGRMGSQQREPNMSRSIEGCGYLAMVHSKF